MRISDWSADVCSSDLMAAARPFLGDRRARRETARIGGAGFNRIAGFQQHVDGIAVGHRHPVVLVRGDRGKSGGEARRRGWGGGRCRGDRKSNTSELQSLMRSSYAVYCLKKKNMDNTRKHV